jgi:hypothetical protein
MSVTVSDQPLCHAVARTGREVSQELSHFGHVPDLRLIPIHLPIRDGGLRAADDFCRLRLMQAKIEAALADMVAERPQFLRVCATCWP